MEHVDYYSSAPKPLTLQEKSEQLAEAYKWRPTGTKGAVPNRSDRYQWMPVRPPKAPEIAKDREIVLLGNEMLRRIDDRVHTVNGRAQLADPWQGLHNWRRHIYFSSGWHRVRLALPGFAWGTAAFILFVITDRMDLIPWREKGKTNH